jgi:hypothetical protein
MRMPNRFLIWTGLCLLLSLLLSGCGLLKNKENPTELVEQFLYLEQQGNFGSSWEKLHPEIQQYWPKEAYIQERAKVFMQIFGARQFEYQLGKPETIEEWTNPLTGTTFTKVQLVPTKITFSSAFGTMSLLQNYYLAMSGDTWYILWDINLRAPAHSAPAPFINDGQDSGNPHPQ